MSRKFNISIIICLLLSISILYAQKSDTAVSNIESVLFAQNNNKAKKQAQPKKAKNNKAANKQKAKPQANKPAANQNKANNNTNAGNKNVQPVTKPPVKTAVQPAVKPVAPAKKKASSRSTVIREEIQRYMGYETLLVRYLSIPYDSSLNSNVDGYYVEIGFLLLMFLPIILIFGFTRKPKYGIAVMIATILLMIISAANGVMMKDRLIRTEVSSNALNNDLNTYFSDGPVDFIIHRIYTFCYNAYSYIDSVLSKISGNSDYITYPLLFFIFFLTFLLLDKFLIKKSKLKRIVAAIILLFTFLWMLLAAGIIWYGYLMLPMGILFIIAWFAKADDTQPFQRITKYAFLGVCILWLIGALGMRISNIYKVDKTAGIHLFDAPVIQYQTGLGDTDDVIQKYFPGLNNALDRVNRDDESLVYSIGTMFPFFIKKNNERILNDNLLVSFQAILDKYPDQVELARVLKTSNFKYILVNLKLYRIDKTPEKSVEERFLNFMKFIYQNPQLELIATDRVVKLPSDNGQDNFKYQVFGDIQIAGSYAIYRIK